LRWLENVRARRRRELELALVDALVLLHVDEAEPIGRPILSVDDRALDLPRLVVDDEHEVAIRRGPHLRHHLQRHLAGLKPVDLGEARVELLVELAFAEQERHLRRQRVAAQVLLVRLFIVGIVDPQRRAVRHHQLLLGLGVVPTHLARLLQPHLARRLRRRARRRLDLLLELRAQVACSVIVLLHPRDDRRRRLGLLLLRVRGRRERRDEDQRSHAKSIDA
jgi:hypothetical protein